MEETQIQKSYTIIEHTHTHSKDLNYALDWVCWVVCSMSLMGPEFLKSWRFLGQICIYCVSMGLVHTCVGFPWFSLRLFWSRVLQKIGTKRTRILVMLSPDTSLAKWQPCFRVWCPIMVSTQWVFCRVWNFVTFQLPTPVFVCLLLLSWRFSLSWRCALLCQSNTVLNFLNQGGRKQLVESSLKEVPRGQKPKELIVCNLHGLEQGSLVLRLYICSF